MKKENKGITLIALVITIIVMLILVGVTVNIALGEDGIVEKSKEATQQYDREKIKEELTSTKVGYYIETGMEVSEETTDEIVAAVQKTKISPDKFIVYFDKHNIEQNKENGNEELEEEYVLYRYDKTTAEERAVLQEEGIKALMGDVDLNGIINESDVVLMEKEIEGNVSFTENQQILGDINRNGNISIDDVSIINQIINGDVSYEGTDL